MRVFAPRRLAVMTYYSPRIVGIPIDGDWIDVPDYFRQITRNKPVNDVIHAKVVDPFKNNILIWDQSVWTSANQVKPRDFTQRWAMDPNGLYAQGWSFGSFTTDLQTVELAPSPKYKGKNRRKKFVEKYVKQRYNFAATFVPNSMSTSPTGSDYRLYGRRWEFGITLYALVEEFPELDYYRPIPRKYVKSLSFVLKSSRAKEPGFQPVDHWIEAPKNVPVPLCLQAFAAWCSANSGYKASEQIYMDHQCLEQLYSFMNTGAPNLVEVIRAYGSDTTGFTVGRCVPKPLPENDMRDAFLLKEPDIIADRIDPLLAGTAGGLSHYWIENLTQHALLEACESLPALNDNSISNIIEIVGFIKALVVDHKIEMPKSLADGWLAYRYQYSTTKLDVNDAIKFVHRHMDLGTLDRQIVGRGSHSIDYQGVKITCRCQLGITPKHLSKLKDIWRALDTYGLTPDFYVIWDMIPYSFMVDWFLPISDIAGVRDANSMYFSGEYYDLEQPCYSLTYVRETDQGLVKCYTRWQGSIPSSLNSFYWFEPPVASSKTLGKRVLDAASIFIGR